MTRVLELTDEQERTLQELARGKHLTVEELLANAVDGLVQTSITRARPTEEQRRRARAMSGRFDFGVSDLAENHDVHLAEAYSHEDLR